MDCAMWSLLKRISKHTVPYIGDNNNNNYYVESGYELYLSVFMLQWSEVRYRLEHKEI